MKRNKLNEVEFELTPEMRPILDGFRLPGAEKKGSLQSTDRDESHVEQAVAYINQALDAETLLHQKLLAFPTIEVLEDREAIGELKALIHSHMQIRLAQRVEIPLYQHLDEVLDAMAGPVVLTTDALRRFFFISAEVLIGRLQSIANGEVKRRSSLTKEEALAIRIGEPIEQVKSLFLRFRTRDICLKDFLDSPDGAEIFFSCLTKEIECHDDARSLLQMHFLSGCTAMELAEYFGIREVTTVKRILRNARKKLWRKAIDAAKKQPGFNSSYTI